MSIFNEAQQLEHLTVIAKSLIRYTMSLEPGIVFERHQNWWLTTPDRNFVGFQFHWSSRVSITLNLYGSPEEQFKQDDLPILGTKFSRSICHVTEEYQLMAASVSIWRAHQLFHGANEQSPGGLILLNESESNYDDWLRPRPGLPNNDKGSISVSETTQWYDEVKAFMKKNKIIDSSIFA
jgi:hypothetical protein